VPASALGAWLTRPALAARLAPPWEPALVSARPPAWREDGRLTYELVLDGIPLACEQEMLSNGAGAVLEERIVHQHPGAAVSERLLQVFAFRHRQLERDLRRHTSEAPDTVTVAITGASGLIGRALAAYLESGGHRVQRLVRPGSGRPLGDGDVAWDPEAGTVDTAGLGKADALVHLAGENLAQRWTRASKRRIRGSRVDGTALLARTLAASRRPRVLVVGSAVGLYGARRAGAVDEGAGPGDDFLAEVVEAWEAAARPAADAGLRVAYARTAPTLDPRGGALAKMLPVFRLGLGGRLGSGQQMFPWVALDDVVGALARALRDPRLTGPFNLIAPEAVTNAGFTRALAAVLGRPAVLAVPGWALRLAVGEMAEAVLDAPTILPAALARAGFTFEHPALAAALAGMLGKVPLPAARGDERRLELEL
jgi:uncharacterized protein